MEEKSKCQKLFMLSGKAKCGKDTVAHIIRSTNQNLSSIELSFSYYLKDYAKRILGWDGSEDTKPRDFFQQLGIDLIQKKIDSHFLIRRLCEDIRVFSYFYDMIIVTDARLIEEIEIPKQEFPNLIVIRVERTNYENGLTKEQNLHITETELDQYQNYDYIVSNDGDEEQLKQKIEKILKELMS